MLKNNGFHNRHSPFIPPFGLGASLALDFTDGADTLDPRITFTRSTTATFTNSAGLIAIAAINAPRFDYDPVTLAPKGLLIEEQRTQLLLNSSLDGTSLATQNVTVTAVAHTLAFYGTGTVTLSGVSTAGPLVGAGAYPNRTALTFTPAAGTLTLTVTGTVQFAQLEARAFATSFIPSAASQVTRAEDRASMTGTNFSSWYNQTEGSVFVDFKSAGVLLSRTGLSISDGTSTNRVTSLVGVTGLSRYLITSGGSSSVDLTYAGPTIINVDVQNAYAFKANDFAASVNGAAAQTVNSVTLPVSVDRAYIGAAEANGSTNYINGTIARIAYYNRRLTNTELQGITS